MNQLYIFVLLSFMILFPLYPTFAQDNGFGIGIIIGEPTGLSLKNWISEKSAIDAGVAWSFVKDPTFHVHADYLLHNFDAIQSTERIPIYYGIGGRIKILRKENPRIGFRGVAGIGLFIRNTPIDLFLELAPILDLIPGTELTFNAGFGARYFFN